MDAAANRIPEFDPYLHDPDRWGVSLSQSAELMLPCLDAAGVRSIVEVGAFAGDLTRVLIAWAAQAGASVVAVDPMPQPDLVKLADQEPSLELVRETSIDALPHIPMPDAIVIDGDHNWHTVTEELRLIAARCEGQDLPLLLFHDVNWPHARRDDYYAAELIPADRRLPVAGDSGGIFPGEPGLRPGGGLPYPRSATTEGGPRNGVLTAVEDFAKTRTDVRLVVVPSFFGFGLLWSTSAPYADEVARIVDAWDGNPLVARLEANRVHHLALGHTRLIELWQLRERLARQEEVLQRLADSSSFSVADALARVRKRLGVAPGQLAVTKDEIRRVLQR
jgi:hypothetical protein